MTAEAALSGVMALQPGDTVLMHAGTGGVGLAALQVRFFGDPAAGKCFWQMFKSLTATTSWHREGQSAGSLMLKQHDSWVLL